MRTGPYTAVRKVELNSPAGLSVAGSSTNELDACGRSPGFTLDPATKHPKGLAVPRPREHDSYSPLLSVRAFGPKDLLCPLLTSATRSGDLTVSSVHQRTRRRSPEVSLTTFTAHPPDLQPERLMGMDFVVSGPLVPPGLPHIGFLSVGSRLCSTLPSDPTSR